MRKSLSAKLPLGARPGPPLTSDGSDSASRRQGEHGRAGSGEHVVKLVVALLFDLVFRDLGRVGAGSQETGRHERERIVGLVLVSRDLPSAELVVRHVLV